ncbi:MAG: glutaminyl-peptide cyclotransferase [Oscillibacter sp.]|nr:glutaminyl-peptide cyclotransferase [Oscillibacter sp.]
MSYFYCIVCSLLLICCNSRPAKQAEPGNTVPAAPAKNNTKYVNSIQFTSPAPNATFKYHDAVNVAFSTKEKFPADSVQIFWNGEKAATIGTSKTEYNYRIPATKTGKNTFKLIAFHPDNKRSVATLTVTVKPDRVPEKLQYKIVREYPHDTKAYTQGLVYQDGILYESTGQYGESSIRKQDMKSGKILSALSIDNRLFGEGITLLNDKIYQLTWTSGKGFIYDLKTFSLESTFTYNTQGWGITTIGDKLIMSDGSHKLYHIAPSSFNIIKEVEVYDHNGPVKNLNELEYINGLVWANVWMQDRIVIIDPATGEVKQELDLSRLLSGTERARLDDSDDVLNGIAWNPEKGTVYVTGKRWPKLFEIKTE